MKASKGIIWTATSVVENGEAISRVIYTTYARFIPTTLPIPLAFNASLAPDVSDGNLRKCALTGSATLTPPSGWLGIGGTEGDGWECWFTASDADRVLTLDAAILLPSEGSFSRTKTIPAGKRCLIGLKFDGTAWMLTTQQGMY